MPPPQGTAPRDGLIEAIARTPILGFRDDVAVRVRATHEGARIDVRSASRYGRHDLGANAARVRALIEDIDDVLAAPAKGEKPEKQAPAPKAPPQPAAKVRRLSGKCRRATVCLPWPRRRVPPDLRDAPARRVRPRQSAADQCR